MTQPLSPATQAIWDAYQHVDCDPYRIDPRQAGIAAALRALADQVVPLPRLPYDSCCDVHAAAIRAEILAIAAELEGGR